MIYTDTLSRWSSNKPGCDELRRNLRFAQTSKLPIKCVLAHTSQPDVIDAGGNGLRVDKTHTPKTEWVGELMLFDGDTIVINFTAVREIA